MLNRKLNYRFNLFRNSMNFYFYEQQAYQDLLGFIMAMNESAKNKKIRDEYPVSNVSICTHSLLTYAVL